MRVREPQECFTAALERFEAKRGDAIPPDMRYFWPDHVVLQFLIGALGEHVTTGELLTAEQVARLFVTAADLA